MNTLSGSRGSVVEYRGVEVMQSGDHDDTPFHSSGTMDPVQGATKRSTPLNNISEVSKPPGLMSTLSGSRLVSSLGTIYKGLYERTTSQPSSG